MEIEKIESEIKQCKKCPNLVKSRTQAVPGYGDPKAKVLFVGLAPGREGADLTGVPFTRDKSGLLFQEMLIRTGFSDEKNPGNEKPNLKNVFVTNIVKCNPKRCDKSGRARNRDPTRNEIENCRHFLEKELRALKLKVIVPLGKESTKLICRELNMNCSSNWKKEVKAGDAVIFPIYHPAFIVRGGGKQKYTKQEYQKDFEKLSRMIAEESSTLH
jgi:DNA polymerase